MGKLLRVLVFVFLVFSIAALALGWMLFSKRTELKARTQNLAAAVVELSATIEAEAGTLERQPDYPERDMSPVTSQVIDSPELSSFWSNYSNELEVTDIAGIRMGLEEKDQLLRYYKVNPVTGKKEKDAMGSPVTVGPGTMQGLLQSVIEKATLQNARLNDTRQQLKMTREELVDAINELNSAKTKCRVSLSDTEKAEAEQARLATEAEGLKTEVEDLEAEKSTLEDEKAEQKAEINLLKEQSVNDADLIVTLKKENDDLRMQLGRKVEDGAGPVIQNSEMGEALEPGVKGKIIDADNEWNFVIIQMNDAAMRELFGDDLSRQLVAHEMMIQRDSGKFVTKIKLRSAKKDKNLVIADVLSDWQQAPVEKGDVVFK